MPQRKCAEKALQQNKKRHELNLTRKRQMKDAIKQFKRSVQNKDLESAKKLLTGVYKTLDKAASKKTIHRNKAARKKSRLATLLVKANSSTKSSAKED